MKINILTSLILLPAWACLGCAEQKSPQPTAAPLPEHASTLVSLLLKEPQQMLQYTHAPRCEEQCLRAGIDSAHQDLNRLLFRAGLTQEKPNWQIKTAQLDYSDLNHAKALIYAQQPNQTATNAIRINLIYIDKQWKLDLSQYINSL